MPSFIPQDTRGIGTKTIEETAVYEKSPFMQGLLAAAHGALLAAPIGASIQALRGKNPVVGALVAALGTGLITGAVRATAQDINNQEREALLRYHADRIKGREPFFFMPPPSQLGQYFSRMHSMEHTRGMDGFHSQD